MPEEAKTYTLKLDALEDYPESEIGLYASYFQTMHTLDINVPKGFVITTSAFEDFLIANDMVSEIHAWLKTLNGSNMNDINKASENIKQLFNAAVIPASIFESIRDQYSNLSRLEESMVSVHLSWIPELKNFSGGIDKKYDIENINGIIELEKIIKHAWQAPFEANAIFERMQQGYNGNISIALVIKKTLAAESSGKLYSYNPLTNNQNQHEIQAVLGMWKGVDVLETIPDHYIVNKQNEAIEEKNVMTQTNMLLKKGYTRQESEERFIKVGITKMWQIRQKISDKIIQDLALIGKTLEETLNQNIELDWVVETGKIYITALRFHPHLRHQHTLSFNKNIVKRDDVKVNSKPTEVEIVHEEDINKTLDQYVDEIEKGISDIDSMNWEEDESFEPAIASNIKTQTRKKISQRRKKKALEIEEEIDEELEVYEEPIEKELFHKLNFKFLYKEKFPTVTKIFVDISQKYTVKNLNSDAFDGVMGIKGEDLIEGYGINLATAKADKLQGFIDYGVSQLMKLIQNDKHKDYIYSLSDLSLDQAIDFADVHQSGLGLHLETDILLNLELEILRIVRNKKNFRRIWLSVNGMNQVADYKYLKNIIDNHTLKKSPSFRFFMEIDLIPPFLNITDYFDESLDGIIVNLDAVLKQIIGSKITLSGIMKNNLFWTMMGNIAKTADSRKIPLILKSKLLLESSEFLQQLLKNGIFGITVNPDKITGVRDVLHKVELKNLD